MIPLDSRIDKFDLFQVRNCSRALIYEMVRVSSNLTRDHEFKFIFENVTTYIPDESFTRHED